jgi:histidine triad (HIT) family protein
MSVEDKCIFCGIARGQSEASVIYRDELVSAFMDLFPVTPGHILVIPNEHFQEFSDVNSEAAGRMFILGRALGDALRRSGLRLEGISYYLAEGAAAGQAVPHAHLHIIPRFPGDECGLRLHTGLPHRAARDTLEAHAQRIQIALPDDLISNADQA